MPNTAFLLIAQYEGRAIIPLEQVRANYFAHLDMPKFLRKLSGGKIELPVVRIEASQKAAKGVRVTEFAFYIDNRRAAALTDLDLLRAKGAT